MSLRALPAEDLEVLCEALRVMSPAPTPPLSWVQALADRRDLAMDQRRTQKYLKQHLTVVMKRMRDAWQEKAADQSKQQGAPSSRQAPF